MSVSARSLLVVLLFLSFTSLHAQDVDYLRHGKIFCLCSYKRICSDCWECSRERYELKYHNKTDKKIKKISYKFYSSVYNKVLEKEAKIEGDVIDRNHIASVYICVPMGEHWIISEIVYSDDSKNTFSLSERLENFIQEPDECECNN
jgi:hypothetical protein